jgi:histidyl-tRNA synthetase
VAPTLLTGGFGLDAATVARSWPSCRCARPATPTRWAPGRAGHGNATLAEGVSELRQVVEMLKDLGVPESDYAVNFSIARGLDYYTGTVYETTLDDYPQIGSICSGGRYENLAGHYSKSKLPGVGISIGATRLFYQLREAASSSSPKAACRCWSG